MAPPQATAMDYMSTSSIEESTNNRPLPFTSAHNRLIESTNFLPRGTMSKAYRQAFGTRVNDVIRDLLERTRLDQEVGLRTAFNRGTSSNNRIPPQRRAPLLQGTSPPKRTTSAERVAPPNNSAIRRLPTSPPWAQQKGRQPAAPVQRGGTPSAPRRPRAYNTDLGESFRRAAAQRAGTSGSSVFGSVTPSLSIYDSPEQTFDAADVLLRRIFAPGISGQSTEYRSAAVGELSNSSDDDEEDPSVRVGGFRRGKYGNDAAPSTFGASSTLPGLPREHLNRQSSLPAGRTKKTDVLEPASAPKYRKSKFTEDLDSLLPSRPVSVRSPLFGNTPRLETTTKRRNWVGGLFGSKAPAAASTIPISTSNGNGGGLFGSAPATKTPLSPPRGGVFNTRSSSASFDSNYAAGDGLGDLDKETIEAIRLARRAAAARGGSGLIPTRRGKYGLSCFTPSFSSKKKNQSKNSSRPLPPSPEFAPRYAGYNHKSTFGGHAEVNGVHRSALKRGNAIRDPQRNTGAQGVAGVSGVHRTERVDTRRAGTGRPRYFAPNPDLRPQNRGQRQAVASGEWLSGGYGRSRR